LPDFSWRPPRPIGSIRLVCCRLLGFDPIRQGRDGVDRPRCLSADGKTGALVPGPYYPSPHRRADLPPISRPQHKDLHYYCAFKGFDFAPASRATGGGGRPYRWEPRAISRCWSKADRARADIITSNWMRKEPAPGAMACGPRLPLARNAAGITRQTRRAAESGREWWALRVLRRGNRMARTSELK
jgi:hypothetical protein